MRSGGRDAYSVAVDGPVGDELREHGAEEAEEGAGCADGDAISADEEHGEDAPAEAGYEVDQPDLPCSTAETNSGQKNTVALHTPFLLLTDSGLQNPNCCSRRMPMRRRLIMLAARWMRPACSQVLVSSRHAWLPCTTPYQSSAPYFRSLHARRGHDQPRSQINRTKWPNLASGGCFLRGGRGAEDGVLPERLEGEPSEEAAADAVAAAAVGRAVVVVHHHHEHGHVGYHHQRHHPRPVVPLLRRRLVVVVERRRRRRHRVRPVAARVVPPRRRLDPRRRLPPRRPTGLHVGVRHGLTISCCNGSFRIL